MYWGLKKVYFLFFVRKPRSSARLKSDMALFRKPACLASSRDISVKISATAHVQNNSSASHLPPARAAKELLKHRPKQMSGLNRYIADIGG